MKKRFKRYASVIYKAPKHDTVKIYNFDTKEEAKTKLLKLTVWPYTYIVHARDENGRFAKGWALICCK